MQLFVDEGSLTEVTAVQRSIADTYQDDFAKYAKQKDLVFLQQVFRYIPRSLGRKVKYSNMVQEEPSLKVKNVIELLDNARICHQVFHSHCTGIPLYADINLNAYKLLFMDSIETPAAENGPLSPFPISTHSPNTAPFHTPEI